MKIGINGLGRIGRTLLRLLSDNPEIQVVAANDIADIATLCHLLHYDSIHRKASVKPELISENIIKFGSQQIEIFHKNHPDDIPWHTQKVDFVVESTGHFLDVNSCMGHLNKGIKGVLLSAPPKDQVPVIVMGVNHNQINGNEKILSNASCTTNSAAPLLEVLDRHFGLESAFITTVHAYTGDQRLTDSPHKDLRRARAAALSIIPTTTGAAKAITRVLPELTGKIGGSGIRVPVPDGSLTDITATLTRPAGRDDLNNIFLKESRERYKGIIEYCTDPIVSTDILGTSYSTTFDAELTAVVGPMIKIVAWYDNETGYANRLKDLLLYWHKISHK
ncbi:MAG: glyceraldehyde-3-phosphate dehydrogenase [Bacteroidota bacterium]|jgi:glyceraldehyde 3-phosphate dehydrogenase